MDPSWLAPPGHGKGAPVGRLGLGGSHSAPCSASSPKEEEPSKEAEPKEAAKPEVSGQAREGWA